MATPVKQFRQPTIFGSPKVTHIFKIPTSDYEKIVNKEWEKNIIENYVSIVLMISDVLNKY